MIRSRSRSWETRSPRRCAPIRGASRTVPVAPVLRAFLAVRSRLAEDALAQVVAAGVQQYVVLGAGLDTFAYRNPHPALRVFEVDHPATQAWKRQRLADAHIAVPEGVTFAAIDFAAEPLPPALCAAGLRDEEPSFFSWLGVTMYLEASKVLATLAAIAPFAANGGGVVFDYNVPPASLAPIPRAGSRRWPRALPPPVNPSAASSSRGIWSRRCAGWASTGSGTWAQMS